MHKLQVDIYKIYDVTLCTIHDNSPISKLRIYAPLKTVENLPSETNDRHTNYVVGVTCALSVEQRYWPSSKKILMTSAATMAMAV